MSIREMCQVTVVNTPTALTVRGLLLRDSVLPSEAFTSKTHDAPIVDTLLTVLVYLRPTHLTHRCSYSEGMTAKTLLTGIF
jgi:hypothetical protein